MYVYCLCISFWLSLLVYCSTLRLRAKICKPNYIASAVLAVRTRLVFLDHKSTCYIKRHRSWASLGWRYVVANVLIRAQWRFAYAWSTPHYSNSGAWNGDLLHLEESCLNTLDQSIKNGGTRVTSHLRSNDRAVCMHRVPWAGAGPNDQK